MPAISIFDIFKVGVGPSSSHTVGPMKAALACSQALAGKNLPVAKLGVRLYRSPTPAAGTARIRP